MICEKSNGMVSPTAKSQFSHIEQYFKQIISISNGHNVFWCFYYLLTLF